MKQWFATLAYDYMLVGCVGGRDTGVDVYTI